MLKPQPICVGVALILLLVAGVAFATEPREMAQPVQDVPTLTVWGKVFSVLLLAALGVAYIVWRRPIMQAQAILETSPLGSGQCAPPLVDWSLYLKVLAAIEVVALISIWFIDSRVRALSTLDGCGILASGAIVALVVHLLILARDGRERDDHR